jgi:protein-serine/threonine kinase
MPQSPSMGGLSGGLKGMLLRRGSSYGSSTHLPRSESALSETNLNSPRMSSPPPPTKEPIYGEHSIDVGDEVKFNVELCRIKDLSGLYILHIKKLRGNSWSFKFIYQSIIE